MTYQQVGTRSNSSNDEADGPHWAPRMQSGRLLQGSLWTISNGALAAGLAASIPIVADPVELVDYSMNELMAATGISQASVLKLLKLRLLDADREKGRKYVFHLPASITHGSLERLVWLQFDHLNSDEAFYRYRQARSIFKQCAAPHDNRIMLAAIAFLRSQGVKDTTSEIGGLIGSRSVVCRARLVEEDDGSYQSISDAKHLYVDKKAGIEELLTTLDPRMRFAPLTCRQAGMEFDQPEDRLCKTMLACQDIAFRHTMAAWIFYRHVEPFGSQFIEMNLNHAFRYCHILQGINRSDRRAVGERCEAFLDGTYNPNNDTDGVRCSILRTGYLIEDDLDEWLSLLDEQDRKAFSRYQIALPARSRDFQQKLAKAESVVAEAGQERRKGRADKIAGRLDQLRYEIDVRTRQIGRLDDALQQAKKTLLAKPLSERKLPLRLSYVEHMPSVGDTPAAHQRVTFMVHSRTSLIKLAKGLHAGAIGLGVFAGIAKYTPDWDDEFHLELVSVEPVAQGGCVSELWLLPMVRSFMLQSPRDLLPDHARERREAIKKYKMLWTLTESLLFIGYKDTTIARAAYILQAGPGRIIVPAEELHYAMSVTCARTRATTTSGARPIEIDQIAASPKCLKVYDDPEKGIFIRYFLAVPKCRETLSPFFIDEDTYQAIEHVSTLARRRWYKDDKLSLIKPSTRNKTKRLKGQPLAHSRRVFRNGEHEIYEYIDLVCHRLMLSGLADVLPYDFRHDFAVQARKEGVPMEVLAKIMNHSDVRITGYYSRPTWDETAEGMGGFIAARVTASEVRRVADLVLTKEEQDALDDIGPFQQVAGGTCLNPLPCARANSCTGCVYNAAEPKRRDQVEEALAMHRTVLAMYERQGNSKYIAMELNTIARHEAQLRQMSLITLMRSDTRTVTLITDDAQDAQQAKPASDSSDHDYAASAPPGIDCIAAIP